MAKTTITKSRTIQTKDGVIHTVTIKKLINQKLRKEGVRNADPSSVLETRSNVTLSKLAGLAPTFGIHRSQTVRAAIEEALSAVHTIIADDSTQFINKLITFFRQGLAAGMHSASPRERQCCEALFDLQFDTLLNMLTILINYMEGTAAQYKLDIGHPVEYIGVDLIAREELQTSLRMNPNSIPVLNLSEPKSVFKLMLLQAMYDRKNMIYITKAPFSNDLVSDFREAYKHAKNLHAALSYVKERWLEMV